MTNYVMYMYVVPAKWVAIQIVMLSIKVAFLLEILFLVPL